MRSGGLAPRGRAATRSRRSRPNRLRNRHDRPAPGRRTRRASTLAARHQAPAPGDEAAGASLAKPQVRTPIPAPYPPRRVRVRREQDVTVLWRFAGDRGALEPGDHFPRGWRDRLIRRRSRGSTPVAYLRRGRVGLVQGWSHDARFVRRHFRGWEPLVFASRRRLACCGDSRFAVFGRPDGSGAPAAAAERESGARGRPRHATRRAEQVTGRGPRPARRFPARCQRRPGRCQRSGTSRR